jgi:hypothetical protein
MALREARSGALTRSSAQRMRPTTSAPVAMFVESNPIHVKWALAQLDKLSPRPPLTLLRTDRHDKVASALSPAAR